MNAQTNGDSPLEHETIDRWAYSALIVVLTWGFRLALAVLLAGLGVALIRDEGLSKHVEPIGDIASGLRDRHAWALVDLGLLLLLLTPTAAVVVILVHYVRCRDWLYSAGAVIVLGTLSTGIVLAFR
jgi:uncharacterized membrane protein